MSHYRVRHDHLNLQHGDVKLSVTGEIMEVKNQFMLDQGIKPGDRFAEIQWDKKFYQNFMSNLSLDLSAIPEAMVDGVDVGADMLDVLKARHNSKIYFKKSELKPGLVTLDHYGKIIAVGIRTKAGRRPGVFEEFDWPWDEKDADGNNVIIETEAEIPKMKKNGYG